MKKVTLLVFLLLAACSSDSENIDTSSAEIESEEVAELKLDEDSSNGVRFLEFPVDIDIDYFFPCIDQKGLNAIPAPQQINDKIRIEFDEGYDQEYIDSFEVAFNECAEEQGGSNVATDESDNTETNEKQKSKNIEVNQNLECKKAFYSDRPEPVKEDGAFFYYKYYWQGQEKICYNYYEAEIIDDDLENQVKLLFNGISEELGLYVPINLTLVDQNRASSETLRQINIDDCKIYDFRRAEDIEECADMQDAWGNRFAAAGVGWSSTANGGNVALFVDNWENYGYQDAIKVFAHEYFHVHQHGLLYYFEDEKLFGIPKAWLNDPEGTIFKDQPTKTYKMPGWIEEGGAEFAGPILATQYDNSIDARKLFEASLDEAKGVISTAASNGDTVSLRDYEFAGYLYESEDNPNNGIAREFAYQYTGGQWAHLYLWSLDDANYEKLMIEYYRNWAENESKNPGEGWRTTFEDLFDMTVDDFYRDFDAFMLMDKSVQMSILPSNEEMQNRKVSK